MLECSRSCVVVLSEATVFQSMCYSKSRSEQLTRRAEIERQQADQKQIVVLGSFCMLVYVLLCCRFHCVSFHIQCKWMDRTCMLRPAFATDVTSSFCVLPILPFTLRSLCLFVLFVLSLQDQNGGGTASDDPFIRMGQVRQSVSLCCLPSNPSQAGLVQRAILRC